MAKLKIEFECDNAAFSDDWHIEAARILREVAAMIESGYNCANIRDINGNRIGAFDYWTI